MNWYKRAQIWLTDGDGSFEENLKDVYELEYKLQAMKNFPFSGQNPKRLEVMTAKTSEELTEAIDTVKVPILTTFDQWLSSHALTSPDEWATQRVKDRYPDSVEAVEEAAYEYDKYANRAGRGVSGYGHVFNAGQALSQAMSGASLASYPSLSEVISLSSEDDRNMMNDELNDYMSNSDQGYVEFGEDKGEVFQSYDEAELWIENYNSGYDLGEYISLWGIESILNYVNVDAFCFEIYKNAVFPVWYNFWQGQGIDATREYIEDIARELQSGGDLNNEISYINQAIMACHQTGDMMDYMEDFSGVNAKNAKHMMDSLTNGEFIPEWNEQLIAVGINVPDAVKNVHASQSWYKKAQYSDPDEREDMFGDLFKKDFPNRTVVKSEEKSEPRSITLFRNFDADMGKIQRDGSGNLILSSTKGEQGVMWFAHSLQGNPKQYYERGAKYLLTYPIKATYKYKEITYSDGETSTEPISDYDARLDNSSSWGGYELPQGFMFSYKNEKHIIYSGVLTVPVDSVKEIN